MIAAKYNGLIDSKLVSLCLSGDAQAWETLIMRYRRLIYSVPAKFNFPPSDSADVFQAVCVKLIENLHSLKDESKVSAWLITTTTRQCIQSRFQRLREAPTEDGFDETVADIDVEDVQIQAQQRQTIRDGIEQLGDRCRQLLTMLYLSPAPPTYEAISQTLKMPVASIGPNRGRCIEKLRTLLRRDGYLP